MTFEEFTALWRLAELVFGIFYMFIGTGPDRVPGWIGVMFRLSLPYETLFLTYLQRNAKLEPSE